jgi:phosphatidylserine/phosphatidylglycerophosphate/cardiolipin synthase-like enzyme
MRLRTTKDGMTLNVVAGTSAVLFSIDMDEASAKDLLGFYIRKNNRKTGTGYDVSSIRYFEETVPEPKPGARYSTKEHPWQSFLWEDFSVDKDAEYQYIFTAVHGKPSNLKYKTTITIDVDIPSPKNSVHEVHFNRGVAGSQAYAAKFYNQRPDKMLPEQKKEALEWLSRGLKEAMINFIREAKDQDYKLCCCFYEFEYGEVAEELKMAAKRHAKVKIIYDARKQKKKNNKAIAEYKVPKKILIPRSSSPTYLQHNKFIVLVEGDEPVAVWTGSTNISEKGIFGQCNTGHIVRDKDVAGKYLAYWNCLSKDPDNTNTRAGCLKIQADIDELADGTMVFFSPREKTKLLHLYSSIVASSKQLVCGMFPFSFNKKIKDAIKADTDYLKYVIIDKKGKNTILETNDFDNVIVYGTALDSPVYNWLAEKSSGSLFKSGTNYIHNKVILIDPLSDDPVVISGSANFSDNSILRNDENTLIIKGDKDVSDLYFTEFSRIFNHYSTRYDIKKMEKKNTKKKHNPNHLWSNPKDWVPSFYRETALKYKRKEMFNGMSAKNV